MFDHSGPFELGEVTGNSGLTHPENFLELGYSQFGLVEEEKKTKAGGIGQKPEQINC
jgi:hypothetical protein